MNSTTLRPNLFQLVRELLTGNFDVAHEGLVAAVTTNGHDDHRIRATQVLVGTERTTSRMGLQELVFHLLYLLAFPLVGNLFYKGYVQRWQLLTY